MKGFIGSIINVAFFPFRILGRIFGFFSKHINFIRTEYNREQKYKTIRSDFIRQKRKSAKLNDELV